MGFAGDARLTSWSCLRRGVDVLARRFPLLFGAWLIILAVQQAFNLLIPASWWLLRLVPQALLLAPLYAGQFLLALHAVSDEPTPFRELFSGFSRWGTLVGISLLTSLLTGIGTLLLIVPGIIWALMFSFAPIVALERKSPDAADGRIGVFAALEESKDLTTGHRGTLFGISLLLGIPSIIVAILFLISAYMPDVVVPVWVLQVVLLLSGTLFLGPLHAASYMVAYDVITRSKKPADQPSPSPSSTNSIPSGK